MNQLDQPAYDDPGRDDPGRDDDPAYDERDDARPRGMSTATQVVLWVLAGIGVFGLIFVYIIIASCSAFLSDVTKDMDKWVTDGSYSPYRRLEVQDVESFVRAEAKAADGGMAGGDLRHVVIKGQVGAVERTPPDSLQIVFRTPAGEVQCRFFRSVMDDLKNTRDGDTLIVGGVIDWINKNTVQLKDCQLQEHWLRMRGRSPR